MLERASDGEAGVDCEDPLVMTACLLDSEDCPAACREASDEDPEDIVVKSGDLAVTATAADGKKVIRNWVSDLDTLTFKTSEEVSISRVVLERYGYSTANNVESVWLEDEDGNIISNKTSSLNTKGQAKLTIDKKYRTVDGTLNATIVLQTTELDEWSTIGFKVVEVESTAENLNLKDYTPATYDIVSYDGTKVVFTVRWGSDTYNYAEWESYEVAKFKVRAADDSAIVVNGFTLKNVAESLKLDVEDYLADVEVYVDDEEVKGVKYSTDKDELTVSFNDVDVAAKESATFSVNIELSQLEDYGQHIQYSLQWISDFRAVEKKTGARISSDSFKDQAWSAIVLKMKDYTFAGGKVRINNEKLGAVDAAIDATDVLVARWEIEVSEAIEGDLSIIATVKQWSNSVAVDKVIERIVIDVAGEEYEGTLSNGKYVFSGVEIEESGKIKVLIDTKDAPTYEGSTITFSMDWFDGFEYSDSDDHTKVDISGSLTFSKVTIQWARGSLTNSLKDEVEYKLNEVNRYTVFEGEYTAKKADVYLNTFAAAFTNVDLENNRVTFYLSINGKEVADAKVSNLSATDDFNKVLIKAGESAKIKLEAEVDARTVADFWKASLTLGGVDTNDNDIDNVSRNTVTMSVVEAGTTAISTTATKDTVLLRKASESAVAEFIVKSDNGSEVDLDSIEFTVAWTTIDNGEDWIDVYVDESSEDVTCSANTCKVEGLTNKLDKNGIVVKIELADEVELDTDGLTEVTVSWLKVNGKPFTNSFKKAYADAVILFSQEDKWDYTLFKIVELKKYNSSTIVKDLIFNDWGTASSEAKCTASKTENKWTEAVATHIAANCKDGFVDAVPATCTTKKEGWISDDVNTHIADNCEDGFTPVEPATCTTSETEDKWTTDVTTHIADNCEDGFTPAANANITKWIAGELSVGDTFEIDNVATTVSISSMSYVVDGKQLQLSRSVYGDYFRADDGSNLRVFSNNN